MPVMKTAQCVGEGKETTESVAVPAAKSDPGADACESDRTVHSVAASASEDSERGISSATCSTPPCSVGIGTSVPERRMLKGIPASRIGAVVSDSVAP